MFCPECGHKNLKEANFCEECGSKIKEAPKSTKITKILKRKKKKKPLTKEIKIAICAGVIAIVVIIGILVYGAKTSNPKTVATNYFDAVTKVDVDKLYRYLNVENSEYVNKDIYKEIIKEDIENADEDKIVNYEVTDVTVSDDELTAEVTFKYIKDDSTLPHTMKINLIKLKEKRLLFFDKWKVNESSVKTVSDYVLTVPKDAEITIANKKVTDKYLSKDRSTLTKDVYVLPEVFTLEYPVKAKLKSGIEFETTFRVNSYSRSATLSLVDAEVPEKMQKQMKEYLNKEISGIYSNALAGKSFEDVKKDMDIAENYETTIKKVYDNVVSATSSTSNKLTKFEIEEFDLERATINSNEDFYLRLEMDYEYTVSYKNGDVEETKTKSSSAYIVASLVYKDGKIFIKTISGLPSYFSRV